MPANITTDPLSFGLTPRQVRLRGITLALLIFIGGMILLGTSHPFFHRSHGLLVTEAARKAYALKLIFIFGYWSICLSLVFSLVIVAWLDLREVRRKALLAQRHIIQEIANRKHREPGDGEAA